MGRDECGKWRIEWSWVNDLIFISRKPETVSYTDINLRSGVLLSQVTLK